MDPFVTAALAIGTSAYNMWAAGESAKSQRKRVLNQKSLYNQSKDFRMKQAENEFLTGIESIRQTTAAGMAGLANSGLTSGSETDQLSMIDAENVSKLKKNKELSVEGINLENSFNMEQVDSALEQIAFDYESSMFSNGITAIYGAGMFGAGVYKNNKDFKTLVDDSTKNFIDSIFKKKP